MLLAFPILVGGACSGEADRTLIDVASTRAEALRSTETSPGQAVGGSELGARELADEAEAVNGSAGSGDGREAPAGDTDPERQDEVQEGNAGVSPSANGEEIGEDSSDSAAPPDPPTADPPTKTEPSEEPAPDPPPLCRIGVTEAGQYAPVEEGGVLPLIGGVQANLILMLGIEVRQALELSTVRIEMWIESKHGAEREYYTLGGPSPSCAPIEGEPRCHLASLAIATSPLAEDPFDLELLPVEVRASLMHRGQLLCEPTLRGRLQRAR